MSQTAALVTAYTPPTSQARQLEEVVAQVERILLGNRIAHQNRQIILTMVVKLLHPLRLL